MPARFRETGTRSARFEFGAGVNAELERGRALPLPRPAGNRSPGFGMRKLRERAGCKRHAGPVPASSVQVDACPCQSRYSVSVSPRRAGSAGKAGMPWANADEEVGACRQQ
jgi:hypothetical protein